MSMEKCPWFLLPLAYSRKCTWQILQSVLMVQCWSRSPCLQIKCIQAQPLWSADHAAPQKAGMSVYRSKAWKCHLPFLPHPTAVASGSTWESNIHLPDVQSPLAAGGTVLKQLAEKFGESRFSVFPKGCVLSCRIFVQHCYAKRTSK